MAKTKLLILESPDACGKTTLISELLQQTSIQLISTPRKPQGSSIGIKDTTSFLDDLINKVSKEPGPFVLDRHVHSNIVYDKVLNRPSRQLADKWHEHLSELANAFDLFELFLIHPNEYKQVGLEDDLMKFTPSECFDIDCGYATLAHSRFHACESIVVRSQIRRDEETKQQTIDLVKGWLNE